MVHAFMGRSQIGSDRVTKLNLGLTKIGQSFVRCRVSTVQ